MSRVLLYSSGIIAEEKPTGGELRFLELAAYMAEQKETALCCADEAEKLSFCGLHADLKMKRAEGAPNFLPEEARILLANRATLKRIAKSDFTAVIAFDVPPAIGLTLFGVRNLVLMIRKDLIGYERVKSRDNGLKKQLRLAYQWSCEGICLRNSKRIICQCAYDRNVILARHPVMRRKLEGKFKIQINNCNPSWVVDQAEKTATEVRDDDRFRICFIGGFDDLRKGQDLFLKAAENLAPSYPNTEFLLVGGGKKLETYRKQYESEQIRFLGRMDNPLAVLKSCDLLAVPSRADSCPNTVLEALYARVPVIASRAGGIPEILGDDDALFSPAWEALKEKIETCVSDPGFLNKLRVTQALRREELCFDWAKTIYGLAAEETEQE